ncbi:hypothetical protein QCA50_010519 [Cerrena zonata]|uniref:RRM domain-containing protein n=1 Tax=Cerrena zonata TaxID=2478898 RepID=A0AAW0FYP0_9APHY
MAEELITKRLHISGLTPAITSETLSQRLGSFGTVQSLDGFGKVDALGQPRKFAYVTIETTKSKLARCMNLLSGVTWKGANLRLGEAKPDFRERIAREHAKIAEEAGEPPRKKRKLPRGVQGVHAEDMTLVTPENVTSHRGWKVTPLGRMVYPVKMRPMHPLPDPLEDTTVSKNKSSTSSKEKKKKLKEPPARARRRAIDPTKWNSKHLKGAFLNAVVAYPESTQPRAKSPPQKEQLSSSSESNDDDSSEGEVLSQLKPQALSPAAPVPSSTSITKPINSQPKPAVAVASLVVPLDSQLLQEKKSSLSLLQSLFGNNDEDWGGNESLSDVDMDEAQTTLRVVEADNNFEVVPRSKTFVTLDARRDELEDTRPSIVPSTSGSVSAASDHGDTSTSVSKPKLKDLFAHREEEVGFSLLGHLDLDDELEEEVPGFDVAQAQVTHIVEEPMATQTATRPTNRAGFLTLDTKEPLFFPILEENRDHIKGKVRDIFDVTKDYGVDWRKFCRTQTEEEIKARWEQNKKDLTQEWKRRHREAIKSRRRRGGYDGGAE